MATCLFSISSSYNTNENPPLYLFTFLVTLKPKVYYNILSMETQIHFKVNKAPLSLDVSRFRLNLLPASCISTEKKGHITGWHIISRSSRASLKWASNIAQAFAVHTSKADHNGLKLFLKECLFFMHLFLAT